MQAETHAGEDVAAFATGANATAVRGVMEQNRLFNVMYDALFEQ
jgi:alkaline phosphatase